MSKPEDDPQRKPTPKSSDSSPSFPNTTTPVGGVELFPPDFERLIFFLDSTPKGLKLGGVRRQFGVSIPHFPSDYLPKVWEGFTHLAAISACLRLLLARAVNRKGVNEDLFLLQDEHELPPLANAANSSVSKELRELLNSRPADKTDRLLHPFTQRDLRREEKGFRTAVHDSVSLTPTEGTARATQFTADHFWFVRWTGEDDIRNYRSEDARDLIDDDELVDLLELGARTRSHFRAKWREFADRRGYPLPVSKRVPMKELGLFLKSYSELLGLTLETVQNRLPRSSDGQWPSRLRLPVGELGRKLSAFHRGKVEERVPFRQLRDLFEAYQSTADTADVPGLMAEWLCAHIVSPRRWWVRLVYEQFSDPLCGEIGLENYATNVHYRNAPERMEMECAFVCFTLEGNPADSPVRTVEELVRHYHEEVVQTRVPHSNLHVHPGDELILVRKGAVVVQFENTGIWTPIAEGDFAHFTAEIPHAVWNLGDKAADVLIVRFFQLARHGTRQDQLQALKEIQGKMTTLSRAGEGRHTAARSDAAIDDVVLGRLHFMFNAWIANMRELYLQWTRIAPWIHDRTRLPQDRLRTVPHTTLHAGSRVKDLVGLSRFLETYLGNMPTDQLPVTDARAPLIALREVILERGRCQQKHVEEQRRLLSAGGAQVEERLAECQRNNVDEQLRLYVQYLGCLDKVCTSLPFEGQREKVWVSFLGVASAKGETPDVSTFAALSRVLRVPRVLLDGYLAPPALRLVAVRGANTATPANGYDWVAPPLEDSETRRANSPERGQNHEYMIPSRVLANSDLSVVLLTLKPKGRTEWNRHPGYEAVIPLEGKVVVQFKSDQGDQMSSPADKESMLLYRSSVTHQVHCLEEEARMIVIRFNIPAGGDG